MLKLFFLPFLLLVVNAANYTMTLAIPSIPNNITGFTLSFVYDAIRGEVHSTGANVFIRLGNNAYSIANPWLSGSGNDNCSALAVGGTPIADGLGDSIYLGVVCDSIVTTLVTKIWVSDTATTCGSGGNQHCIMFTAGYGQVEIPTNLVKLADFRY